jgi:hypothetical protein
MMPEITRRSSTRRARSWFFGKCGSIAFHASADNQNNAFYRLHRHTLCESGSPLQINSLIGFEP